MASDDLARVRTLSHSTLNLAAAIEDAAAGRPASGSPAAEELSRQGEFAGPWGAEPLALVHAVGEQLSAAAVEHVIALAALVDLPAPPTAGRTLTGSLTQACASLWWVCDPAVGLRGRLARGCTDAWRWADLFGHPPLEAALPADVLRAVAQQFGFTLVVGDAPVGLDQPRPSTAALVEAMLADLAGPLRQRLLAVVGEALRDPLGLGGSPSVLGAAPTAGERTDDRDVVALAGAGALVYVEAFARKAAYYGWEQSQWQAWRTHAHTTLAQLHGP